MSRLIIVFLSFLLGFSAFISISNPAFCNLEALNNDGEAVLYGSVLSPKEDEVNILLPKPIASKIKKAGVNKFSFTLISALDSSKRYIIPNELVTIRRKIINKKRGIYLTANLFTVFSESGISVSASSLPKDNYKLKIDGVPVFGTKLNEISEPVKYEPPSLIVGTVASRSAGIITVEDLNGNTISDKTVTANPNGTFFTEVRANKTKPQVKSRKNFKFQTVSAEIAGPADFTDTFASWYDLTENKEDKNDAKLFNFSLPSNGKSGWVGSNTKSDPSALRFDGVDDYIELEDYLPDLKAFSVEMWVKRNGDGIEFPRLFANTADYSLTLYETSDNVTSISNGGVLMRLNGNPYAQAAPGTLDGTWQHLIFLWDGNNTKIYLNGVQIGETVPFTEPLNPYIEGHYPVIGGESATHASNAMASAFNGDIARVDVYDYALSEQQIKNNFINSSELYIDDTQNKKSVCASVNRERGESEKGNVLSFDARNIDDSGYINEQALKTGIVHAVTEKDLLSITSLDNSSENNNQKAEQPLEISESSTLTANLVKENEDLAIEVANSQLEETALARSFQTDFSSLNCDINKFVNRCGSNDPTLSSDIKNLLLSDECNLPFIVKKVISEISSDCLLLSEGYCSHVKREVDEEKPCEIYEQIIKDFEEGKIEELPCPPESCEEFKEIAESNCAKPITSCEDASEAGSENINCFKKPAKDLHCTRVGKDIITSECSDENFDESNKRGWTIVKNSKGNEYCIATKTPAFLLSSSESGISQSPEETAENCELNSCHKACNEENRQNLLTQTLPDISPPLFTPVSTPVSVTNSLKCEICDCHYKCDAESGRFLDCSNLDFFSVKCCDNTLNRTLLAQAILPPPQFSTQAEEFNGISNLGEKGFKGPIVPDARDCYCKDKNNFNEKGYIKEEAKLSCSNQCPDGYESDPESNLCLPICDKEKGQVRTAFGICKKKCPDGFIEDVTGTCRCPDDKMLSANGKCENIQGGLPGPKTCLPGQTRNPATGECTTVLCGPDQFLDSTGICRCNLDGLPVGPEGCKKSLLPNTSPFPGITPFPFPSPGSTPNIFPGASPFPSPNISPFPTPSPFPAPSTSPFPTPSTFPFPTSSPFPTPSTSPFPTPSPFPSPTPITCFPGQIIVSPPTCTCAVGATSIIGQPCQCPSGKTYTINGCVTQ